MGVIVVPVADVTKGHLAVERAKEEARRTGAEIVLVAAAQVSGHLVANVEALESLLDQLEKELLNEGFQCRSQWFIGESLAKATLDTAAECDAELIVMNLRRRTAVGKAIFGSYEQTVLLHSHCPVLTLPIEPW